MWPATSPFGASRTAGRTRIPLGGIRAYPEGFEFTLGLRLRTVSAREQQFPDLIDGAAYEGDALPDALLRFGVQFADGRKATNLDRPDHDPEGPTPDRPVLIQQGGGGGGTAWDMEHWVWPLPPPGPFACVCAWSSRGVAESRAEIDAGVILEAAGRAGRDLVAARPVSRPRAQRSRRKNSRTSPTSRSGASMAAKWPPRSNSDQCTMLLPCSA